MSDQYAFELLNTPDNGVLDVTALNDQGDVVGVGRSDASPVNYSAILWKANAPLVIVNDRQAVDINDDDEIICKDRNYDYCTWASGGGGTFSEVYHSGQVHTIMPLPGMDYPYVDAMAINRNGVVTGGCSNPESGVFIYDSRAGTPMKFLGFDSVGYAINDQHQVAAMPINLQGRTTGAIYPLGHAFLIEAVNTTAPTTRDLGEVLTVEDMNDAVEVVGMRVAGGASDPTAYLCKASDGIADFIDLGVLPGYTKSYAHAINSKGDVVGACYSSNRNGYWNGDTPFLWSSSGGMQDLNSLCSDRGPWRLQSAKDINENGQILGMCASKQGTTAAFLLTPIPDFAYSQIRYLGQIYDLLRGSDGLVWFGPGTRPIPIDPRVLWEQSSTELQDILIGMSMGALSLFAQARSREEMERSVVRMIRRAIEKLRES